ncbi:THAP domain-containing protein 1-like [Daktulosphaira vitifoliae]|uniref:THAP domain-containing protein 1-like n=1 Tax=Daktulosphaira vitifoliae TaxID=58002 RepID=UPI0021AA50C4|nr:THAP domain-containing protein 1-like [Daktulosphaira vitifoliae]
MVNKCSVTGCKSLYARENVKLHRFPLGNAETLPHWIAATKREPEWKPCKSSRLCGNHFQESEYIVGHGKGILKSSAIPTIDYCVTIPRYNKKKNVNYKTSHKIKDMNNPISVESKTQKNDSTIEIVKVDYNDDYDEELIENYDFDCQNSYLNSYEEENHSYNINEMSSVENILQNNTINEKCDGIEENYEKYVHINEIKNSKDTDDFSERQTQCYVYSNSFKEGIESLILTDECKSIDKEKWNEDMNQSIADKNFNKILRLKKKRRTKDIYSLYFKSLIKKKGHNIEKNMQQFFNDDAAMFGAFIETQMKELYPHKKLYMNTKHKIQKILMKAQLKMTD